MEYLRSYLTAEGWRNDWEQTKADLQDFFAKNRRPTLSGIEEPTSLEIKIYKTGEAMANPISKCLDAYFLPKSFEKSCRLYEVLGIRPFRYVVINTAGVLHKVLFSSTGKKGSNYYVGQDNRTIRGLKNFDNGLRYNETLHLVAGVFMSADLSFDFTRSNTLLDLSLFTINTYLIFLQRYNRARVYNTIDEKIAGKISDSGL